MHGVMRGMFPLQVIRYLRGSGVIERLNREGERWWWVLVGGGGLQNKDKATETHRDVWYNILALLHGVQYEKHWVEKKKQQATKKGTCSVIAWKY